MIATTSAIISPSLIAGRADRFTKLGPRKCTRSGFGPPFDFIYTPSSPLRPRSAYKTSPGGTLKSFCNNEEMVDQRIHMLSHIIAIGQNDFRSISLDRTGFNLSSLADDLIRSRNTRKHSDAEPCPHIAVRFGWNIKVVSLVTCVWVVSS